jgi:murein L,D-transpeptidase YafK
LSAGRCRQEIDLPWFSRRALKRGVLVALLLAALAGTAIIVLDLPFLDTEQDAINRERHARRVAMADGQPLSGTPDLTNLSGRLAANGVALGAPVFIRIFKREFELELWMKRDGRFHRFAAYPICNWSGGLGPKLKSGDHQAPEGFYTVDALSLNPNSRWHRSFNLGFPNPYDRAYGRTGSFLMVHGGCSSDGCYAMTNAVVDEIWKIVTAAFGGGQKRFHVHVFPFRMTPESLEERQASSWMPFWRDLANGYEAFERDQLVPRIAVCRGRYVVSPGREDSSDSAPIESTCPPASLRTAGSAN